MPSERVVIGGEPDVKGGYALPMTTPRLTATMLCLLVAHLVMLGCGRERGYPSAFRLVAPRGASWWAPYLPYTWWVDANTLLDGTKTTFNTFSECEATRADFLAKTEPARTAQQTQADAWKAIPRAEQDIFVRLWRAQCMPLW